MKKNLLPIVLAIFSIFNLKAANQNIANLITSSDWSTIFPNRAQNGHNQGATDDFYSYARFVSAVDEISNYSVTFSTGPEGQGTSVAVTKAGTPSWTYVINSSSWSGDDYTVDYSKFCNTGNDYNDKRELAAFLANITKETTGGWNPPDPDKSANLQPEGSHGSWGLHWLRELNPTNTTGPTAGTIKPTTCYTTGSQIDYQPAVGKCYYGRGPIQLSYFYNYGNFSEFLYNNTSLVSNPDLLEQNGELAFLSALWFWMTPQCPKPSCHQVMQEIYDESATSYSKPKMSKKGFLHTVNIINGSVECHDGAWDTGKPVLRSQLYRYYMSLIGFSSTEISNEDLGEYSTQCNLSGSKMEAYASCDFNDVVVNNCSAPALGDDQVVCSGSVSLDASIALQGGESIAWYKGSDFISGETSTTIDISEAGTYKAVVTGTDCSKEDEVIISFSEGGLELSASNDGKFCGGGSPVTTTISVTGGGGSYNLYTTLTGGEPLYSGSDFTIGALDVGAGESETYYIDEPAGIVYTIGMTSRGDGAPSESYNGNGWHDLSGGGVSQWTEYNYYFTTSTNLTLESVDLDLGSTGSTTAILDIKVKDASTGNIVESKTIDLSNTSFSLWDAASGASPYTAPIGFELTPGQYFLDLEGSTGIVTWISDYTTDSGNQWPYSSWSESGKVQLDYCRHATKDWGNMLNAVTGVYNWQFSEGGGSGSSCGRTAITISNDCTVGSEELSLNHLKVYPNPANEIINIAFEGINTDGAVIQLHNQVGQIVLSSLLNGNLTSTEIQTSELEAGIYFIKVTSGKNTYNTNVIVTK